MEIVVEPRHQAARPALDAALGALTASDPSFVVFADPESGQIVVSGPSEDQVGRAVETLRKTCEINVGSPQVAYRETLGQAALIDHVHNRLIGAGGEFARVVLRFEPLAPGAGFTFEHATEAVPPHLAAGVLKGVVAAKAKGLLAGFPVIDFKASLVGGAWHDLDSTEQTFETAARAAFRELRTKGAPILLEPIMWVEVLTPDGYLAEVIGDLNSRRGQIQSAEQQGDAQLITALAPLTNLFGYPRSLELITEGAGRSEMRFDRYDPMPTFEPPDGTFPPAVGMRA